MLPMLPLFPAPCCHSPRCLSRCGSSGPHMSRRQCWPCRLPNKERSRQGHNWYPSHGRGTLHSSLRHLTRRCHVQSLRYDCDIQYSRFPLSQHAARRIDYIVSEVCRHCVANLTYPVICRIIIRERVRTRICE